jgi:hypothetical protein
MASLNTTCKLPFACRRRLLAAPNAHSDPNSLGPLNIKECNTFNESMAIM